MAKHRMFAMDFLCADEFFTLPTLAQLLYYNLGMVADDDGFTASVRRTMRDIGADESDLQALIDKGYILRFDNVVLITHWKVHNSIPPTKHTKTAYKREFAQVGFDPDTKAYYLLGIPREDQRSPDQEREAQGSPDEHKEEKVRGAGGEKEGGIPIPETPELFTPEEYAQLQGIYDPARLDGAIGVYRRQASPYAQNYEAFRSFVDQLIPTLKLEGRDGA